VPRFWRIVHRERLGAHRAFGDATDRVAGQLQLISNHQNVFRLQLAVHLVVAVQERKRVQGRPQHFPRLVIRQRASLQHLRKRLIGVFHHDIKVGQSVQLAPARLQQSKQVWMGDAASPFPSRQQGFRQAAIGGNELDRDFRRVWPRRPG